jgi:hypothetical protein
VAGLALDVGLRGGLANLPVAIGLAVIVIALATDRRLRQRSARIAALAALAPFAFLALRTSTWLVTSNLLAGGALVAVGIAFSRSGSPTDTTVGRVARRLALAVPAGWTAPRSLAPLVPDVSKDRTARLVRIGVAALACIPVLVVVAALLATADPVFAGLLQPDLDAGPSVGHVLLIAVLALAVVCVVGLAASDAEDPAPRDRIGALEAVTALGLTAALLGLFVLAQVIAVTSAGERLVERSGLTPAEYARSGFFQLCWAAGIIVTLLAVIRALVSPDVLRAPTVRVLGALVPGLALGLVVVSLRRMALYDQAFGLTMLRLWVLGAAVWMGAVLIFVAVRNAGIGTGREWVLPASLAAAVVLVLVADVANPEAYVARHNLARAQDGAELDPAYLAQLSDDATPILVAAYEQAGPEGRAELEPALRCGEGPDGVARLNLSAARATAARDGACEAVGGG